MLAVLFSGHNSSVSFLYPFMQRLNHLQSVFKGCDAQVILFYAVLGCVDLGNLSFVTWLYLSNHSQIANVIELLALDKTILFFKTRFK